MTGRKANTTARTKPLRAIYVVSPVDGDYPVTEAIVEQQDGKVVMLMMVKDRVAQGEPDRPTIEQLLDHRASGIVNTCVPVMVGSLQEARRQMGKPYRGPTGWPAA